MNKKSNLHYTLHESQHPLDSKAQDNSYTEKLKHASNFIVLLKIIAKKILFISTYLWLDILKKSFFFWVHVPNRTCTSIQIRIHCYIGKWNIPCAFLFCFSLNCHSIPSFLPFSIIPSDFSFLLPVPLFIFYPNISS